MWNKIVNPKTGKKVNLNSKIGKSVLRNYMKQMGGAGEAAPPLEQDVVVEQGHNVEEPLTCWDMVDIEDKNVEGFLKEDPLNFVIEYDGMYSCQNLSQIHQGAREEEPEHFKEFYRCYDGPYNREIAENGNVFTDYSFVKVFILGVSRFIIKPAWWWNESVPEQTRRFRLVEYDFHQPAKLMSNTLHDYHGDVVGALHCTGATEPFFRLEPMIDIHPGVDLRLMDFQGADFNGMNLTGVNLTGANLTGANLTGANLTGADLTDANFTNANLTEANLSGATLTGANFTGATLTGMNLTGANFTGADFTGANFNRCEFNSCYFNECKFNNYFNECKFNECKFNECKFIRCEYNKCEFIQCEYRSVYVTLV